MIEISKKRSPVRILQTICVPWKESLGASKIQISLSKYYSKAGWKVSKISYDDIFPKLGGEFFLFHFWQKTVKKFGRDFSSFDIIESNEFSSPISVKGINFRGLTVFRSYGLSHFCEQRLLSSGIYFKERGLLKFLAKFPLYIVLRIIKYFWVWAEIRNADLVITGCSFEQKQLMKNFPQKSIYLIPFGLHQSQLESLSSVDIAKSNKVVFIGYWQGRKGSKDWGKIIKKVWESLPETEFLFLGTGNNDDNIWRDLAIKKTRKITNIAHYETGDLPGLLNGSKVGAFPSYYEGFGFAVIEKLAAGIPTVGFRSPGVEDTLCQIKSYDLLTPCGNTDLFAKKIVELLRMPEKDFGLISDECKSVARKYNWEDIAKKTMRIYTEHSKMISP